MNEVQKAIENVTYFSKKFPEADFQIICEHQEEAKPYLYKALDDVIEKEGKIEEDYELHIYALFLLAEFHDTEAFERIIALISIPSETLSEIMGDVITEGLKDVMYHTYNGNPELLKDFIRNPDADVYARMAALKVMGQLYMDGSLEETEWKEYLKSLVASTVNLAEEVYTIAAEMICKCHFGDMLSELRSLFDRDCVDKWYYRNYSDCVDEMFDYNRENRRFCKEQVSIRQLKNWAMYGLAEEDEDGEEDIPELFRTGRSSKPSQNVPVKKQKKIGRNDPCPCGSGKKYKHCCLNKPKEKLTESEEDREKWLEDYPETGSDRVESRIYLEDYFDQESIEIDRLIYIAFKCHSTSGRSRALADDSFPERKKRYLLEAFSKYKDKMIKEGIQTNEEYDKKYSIHYQTEEWQNDLLVLLEESDELEDHRDVYEYFQK